MFKLGCLQQEHGLAGGGSGPASKFKTPNEKGQYNWTLTFYKAFWKTGCAAFRHEIEPFSKREDISVIISRIATKIVSSHLTLTMISWQVNNSKTDELLWYKGIIAATQQVLPVGADTEIIKKCCLPGNISDSLAFWKVYRHATGAGSRLRRTFILLFIQMSDSVPVDVEIWQTPSQYNLPAVITQQHLPSKSHPAGILVLNRVYLKRCNT